MLHKNNPLPPSIQQMTKIKMIKKNKSVIHVMISLEHTIYPSQVKSKFTNIYAQL